MVDSSERQNVHLANIQDLDTQKAIEAAFWRLVPAVYQELKRRLQSENVVRLVILEAFWRVMVDPLRARDGGLCEVRKEEFRAFARIPHDILARDKQKRRSHVPLKEEDLLDEGEVLSQLVVEENLEAVRDAMRAAVANYPPNLAEAIEELLFGETTVSEVAFQFGTSATTVRQWKRRAIKKAELILGFKGFGSDDE